MREPIVVVAMTNSKAMLCDSEDDAIRRTAEEIRPVLKATETTHAIARYTLGERVNELESKYGDHTIDKLAKALGRGYGPDNLRTFARIARLWKRSAFEVLAKQGLDISDFRELAKLPDDTTRTCLEQQAIEKSWSIEALKKAVRMVFPVLRLTLPSTGNPSGLG